MIGAGFAGLTAAERLAAAGREVVVCEARDRVGGRVWSQRLPAADGPAGLIERGGEFITGGYDLTEATAARLGLGLDGMAINYPDRELRPGPGPAAGELLAGAESAAAAAAGSPAGSDAAAVLAAAVERAEVREVLATRLQSALAHPFADLDCRFLLHLPYLVQSAETKRVRGGNQAIATALATRLPAPVRLGCPVRQLRRDEDGTIRLRGDDGDVEAGACVVAVPVALLPELDFDPPLPTATAAAIAAITTSRAAKLAVPLRSPAPPRALMSASDRFWAWTTACDGSGGRIANAWAGAAPVLDALAVGAGPERWIERLAALWPELDADPAAALLTDWQRDPWARGAYSVLPDVPDPAGDAAAAAPAANVVFAGEHTAEPEWTGTMEGALRSGVGAAERLLAAG